MDQQKPVFASGDRSIRSIVTELHSYFRDLQSYYQIARDEVAIALENTADPARMHDLKQQLQKFTRKLQYLHLLDHSIASADVILHTEEMIDEFNSSENKGEPLKN
ncbi:hypothetical protein V0288_19455 [Pannus brasiliensis CCIBt3594]|uniref:Uncharacterized protein n=1 Tax=Pannus brasiliensis CCIBt3594 TaxID=1427578 RepID=A0AAW9QY93_9CHRO